MEHMTEVAISLENKFNITPWLLIVPVVTGILIARKVPSIITLTISTFLACIAAIIFQPNLLNEIAGEENLFKGVMITCYGSTNLETGNAALTELVATRGMAGMTNTIWLILCSMCFGGAMTASGMLGKYHICFCTFYEKPLQSGFINSMFWFIHELSHCRPVHKYHSDRKHVW